MAASLLPGTRNGARRLRKVQAHALAPCRKLVQYSTVFNVSTVYSWVNSDCCQDASLARVWQKSRRLAQAPHGPAPRCHAQPLRPGSAEGAQSGGAALLSLGPPPRHHQPPHLSKKRREPALRSYSRTPLECAMGSDLRVPPAAASTAWAARTEKPPACAASVSRSYRCSQ